MDDCKLHTFDQSTCICAFFRPFDCQFTAFNSLIIDLNSYLPALGWEFLVEIESNACKMVDRKPINEPFERSRIDFETTMELVVVDRLTTIQSDPRFTHSHIQSQLEQIILAGTIPPSTGRYRSTQFHLPDEILLHL